MAKQLVQAVETQPWSSSLAKNAALVVGASLLMGILGRFALPLPFTPVPLTLANFGVLLVGLTLGSRRGFAALTLYLVAAAADIFVAPQFGTGGHLQILSFDTNANVERAPICSPTIFAVAIVRRTDRTGVAQPDSAAQARRFKMLAHVSQAQRYG